MPVGSATLVWYRFVPTPIVGTQENISLESVSFFYLLSVDMAFSNFAGPISSVDGQRTTVAENIAGIIRD